MEALTSKVYVLVDNQNRIIKVDGGYTINVVDTSTWILIDEGVGDKFNLCQTHYFDKPLFEKHGIPVYKFENGECKERTSEEIEADIPIIPSEPSIDERVTDLEIAVCEIVDTLA